MMGPVEDSCLEYRKKKVRRYTLLSTSIQIRIPTASLSFFEVRKARPTIFGNVFSAHGLQPFAIFFLFIKFFVLSADDKKEGKARTLSEKHQNDFWLPEKLYVKTSFNQFSY